MSIKENHNPQYTNSEVKEPHEYYHANHSTIELHNRITQSEIDEECITLEESRRRLINTIHQHFHKS
jgi:hypothetical protein